MALVGDRIVLSSAEIIDHVGGVVRDRVTGTVHGVSWG